MDPPIPSKVEIDSSRDYDVVEKWEIQRMQQNKDFVVTRKLVTILRPPPYFLHSLAKKTDEGKYRLFISMLKQLSINVLFIEALV